VKTISETSFYAPPEQIQHTTLSLFGPEAKHAHTVLRCSTGDRMTVVDGCGYEYAVSVGRVLADRVECTILRRRKGPREPTCHITLAQSLCRSPRFDIVVEKTTELGVRTILPVITERSVPRFQKEHVQSRIDRWRKVAMAAMKQSRRSILPTIGPAVSFDEILTFAHDFELSLVASEKERESGLRTLLGPLSTAKRALILVGPEGGFSEREIERTKKAGLLPFSIGPRRLRAETAGIVAVSLLLYERGDLGIR